MLDIEVLVKGKVLLESLTLRDVIHFMFVERALEMTELFGILVLHSNLYRSGCVPRLGSW